MKGNLLIRNPYIAALVVVFGIFLLSLISVSDNTTRLAGVPAEEAPYTSEIAAVPVSEDYFESGFVTPASCSVFVPDGTCWNDPDDGSYGCTSDDITISFGHWWGSGTACQSPTPCWDGSYRQFPAQTCPPVPIPDLTPLPQSGFTTSDLTPEVGDNVTLCARIRNGGVGASGGFNNRFEISPDQNWDGYGLNGDTAEYTGTVAGLSSGSSRNECITWVPTDAGTFYTRIRVDSDENIAESSEGNNRTNYVQITVTTPAPAPIVNLWVDDPNPPYNTSTTLRWSVSDATNCTASNGWSGSKNASGGAESTVNLTAPTTFVLTCTGPGGLDNDAVTVPPLPAPTIDTFEVCDGASCATGGNTLTVPLGNDVEVNWDSSDTNSCSVLQGGTSDFQTSGGTGPVTGPSTDNTITEPGTVGATANFQIRCTDGSTDVDSGQVTIEMTDVTLPNLTPNGTFPANPGTLKAGYTLNFTMPFINNGSVDATGFHNKFTYRWNTSGAWNDFPSGAEIAHPGGLTAGATGNDAASFVPAQGGNLYIQFCTDSRTGSVISGEVIESSEADNCYQTPTPYLIEGPPSIDRFEVCDDDGSGCTGSAPKTIDVGDDVEVVWESSNADNCYVESGGGNGFQTNPGNAADGIDDTISEPSGGNSTTFRIRCSNGVTDVLSNPIQVNVNASAPSSVSIEACEIGGVNCESGTKLIGEGVEVEIRWDSTGATACQPIPPQYNFATDPGNAPSGTDGSVDEPAVGGTHEFRVSCENSGVPFGSTPSVSVTKSNASPTLTASKTRVRLNEPFDLDYDTAVDPTVVPCTLTGGGIDDTLTTQTDTYTGETITGKTIYTLQCQGFLPVTETVELIPGVFES